jgi:hypothetical protein
LKFASIFEEVSEVEVFRRFLLRESPWIRRVISRLDVSPDSSTYLGVIALYTRAVPIIPIFSITSNLLGDCSSSIVNPS